MSVKVPPTQTIHVQAASGTPIPLRGISRVVCSSPPGWVISPQHPLPVPPAATSRSGTGTPVPAPPPPSASSTPAGQPTAITRLHMQLHLHDLQQNASDLRNQLQQLKKLQVGTGGGHPNPSQLLLGWLQPWSRKIPFCW